MRTSPSETVPVSMAQTAYGSPRFPKSGRFDHVRGFGLASKIASTERGLKAQ
jgi:hypothetical protein